ncbi:MAG: HIT domain-containing protein [Nanoarchaeota archaeon]|nr:HIT domain-containing protein [Nanoarchaeota archaeon]
MIPKEQIEQVKNQLIGQIESTFPKERKDKAISQIASMNEEELEQFLIQNKLIKTNSESVEEETKIFRLIVEGKIPSTKVAENSDAIAVLEINPISNGHILIIPKSPAPSSKELTKSAFDLANEIKEKLEAAFSPKEVKIISTNSFGEEIINLIPVYKNENLNSKRSHLEKHELVKLKEEIDSVKVKEKEIKKEKSKSKKILTDKNTWLPRRKP